METFLEPNSSKLLTDLKANIEGDVDSSFQTRASFAKDESIFQLLPVAVVAPKNEQDIKCILQLANHYNIAVTARGGGTGVAGQSIGAGIVLDFKKHFHNILDVSQDRVLVQSGVVLKDLNHFLYEHGRRFAPDPGSYMSCTLGGMVSTNASGPHGFMYGSTRDHILNLKVCLTDGVFYQASELAKKFPTLCEDIKKQRSTIAASTPAVRKNSSGYALLNLTEDFPSFEKFLVGTEGTLAVVTDIYAKTIPLAEKTTLAIMGFSSMQDAVLAAAEIRDHNPVAIELLDNHILMALEKANSGILSALHLSDARASLWVEWEDVSPPASSISKAFVVEDTSGRSNLWSIRSKASRYLHEQARSRKPLRCIEDTVVPQQHIGSYVAELSEILKSHDCEGAIFGHIGDGHLHVNPSIDVIQSRLWQRIHRLMDEVYALALQYGGSISGEHGDGMLRAPYAKRQWKQQWEWFQLIKNAFDPKGILNPGKKVEHKTSIHPPLRSFN